VTASPRERSSGPDATGNRTGVDDRPVHGRSGRRIHIGTAGWSIPRASAFRFGAGGTHLQRYARTFNSAEINSSFYRGHAESTYAKWAESVPAGFRFAVKVPRTITHDQKLRRARAPFSRFLEQVAGLRDCRGPLLVQLPPSLSFETRVARTFLDIVRSGYDGAVVCEPRHPTWFDTRADDLLTRYAIGRVAADPPPARGGDVPGGWSGIAYFRLHGSPRKYWSRYETAYIESLAETLTRQSSAAEVWCIFDNTASGAALENAWDLRQRLLEGNPNASRWKGAGDR